MNTYSLKFLDETIEKDFNDHRKLHSSKAFLLLYSLITLLQLGGLFMTIKDSYTPLYILILWSIVPVITFITSQAMIKILSWLELGLLIQRVEIAIYLIEFLFLRFFHDNQSQAFFLGILANCLYFKWGDPCSWFLSVLEVLICYTYFFLRTRLEFFHAEYGSLILYFLVLSFVIVNSYVEEAKFRKGFLRNHRLHKENTFWRSFFENIEIQPGLLLELKGLKKKKKELSLKKGFFKKTSLSTGGKILKKLEYSLEISNSAAKNKLSIFSKEDLVELFKNAEFFNSDQQNPQKLFSFEEILLISLTDPTKTLPKAYSMRINSEKHHRLKKGKLFLCIIPRKSGSKTLELLISMKIVEYQEELERLRELDKVKDKILANVTHDLRSPLNGVMNFIDQAIEEKDIIQRNRMLEYAKINSDLLLNLINDILDFSQHKEGKLRICISTFGVLSLAEEVMKLMDFKAESKGIRLILSSSLKEERYCESDPKRLKQVLINLIGNALKFTSKGYVKLVISPTDYSNLLKFEIVDSGCGIVKEKLNQLFTPFVTFSEFGNNNYGIGLGLTICQSIVQIIGPSDKLFFSSVPGKGTKVGFLFFTNHENKNSINGLEKSVIIPKDSAAIFVGRTIGNQNQRGMLLSKAAALFSRTSLPYIGNPELGFSVFKNNISNEKKVEENQIIEGKSEDCLFLKGSFAEKTNNEMNGISNGSPEGRNQNRKCVAKTMENMCLNRTNTILRTLDMKEIIGQNVSFGNNLGNSSILLSKSAKVNCSDYFSNFSVMEYKKSPNERGSLGFLESAREDSYGNIEENLMEELENGRIIQKPLFFLKDKEEKIDVFSFESNIKESPKVNSININMNYQEELNLSPTMKVETPCLKIMTLKNLGLEEIMEDVNEEGKQDKPFKGKKIEKSFSFIQYSPQNIKTTQQKNSLNVLVVDDDPFNTMIIARFFEKLPILTHVKKCSNGQEALDLFKKANCRAETAFHIIVMDCQMPVMNGFEGAKHIKECIKSGLFEGCIVIAVTAYNLQDEEEKCLLSGMDAVLTKPVSEREFRELLRQFLIVEECESNTNIA